MIHDVFIKLVFIVSFLGLGFWILAMIKVMNEEDDKDE